MDQKEDTLNLFMNYDTFGNIQPKESGIFEFLKAFPKEVLSTNTLSFSTPSDLIEKFQPISALSVPHAISWADEERDTSAWLGNELQKEAFYKLFNLRDMVLQTNDPKILTDWKYFQTSDHFYYMCTKFFVKGSMHSYFNPFSSPYDAFINYMNILSDFEIKIKLALSSNNSGIKKTNGNGTKKTNNIAAKTDKEKVKKVVKKTTAKTAKPTKEDVVVEKTNKKTAKKETTKEKVKKSKKA